MQVAEKTELLGNILEHGIDLKNRRIYFGSLSDSNEDQSEFNWKSVERAIRALHILEAEDSRKPIEIHMCSPGGDSYSLLRLHDAILSCSCQIKFFGSGEISSAATWIMACCDERNLTQNTYVLIHDSGSYETGEVPAKLTDAYIAMDQERRMQDRLNKMYAENSRMPEEFWSEIVKRDVWLTAEETIMLGLADKIIEPKKRGNLRKARINALKQEVDKKELQKLLKNISNRSYVHKLNKIELHSPNEEFDKDITVDLGQNQLDSTL
jgi:ATP-dependent Clp protease, protease subunit